MSSLRTVRMVLLEAARYHERKLTERICCAPCAIAARQGEIEVRQLAGGAGKIGLRER